MNTPELLQRIESKGDWLRTDARSIADAVIQISHRRDFPTLAEEGLDLAERELIDALATVRRARAAYLAKPAERDPYYLDRANQGEEYAAS